MLAVLAFAVVVFADMNFSSTLNVTGTLQSDSLATAEVVAQEAAVVQNLLSADSINANGVFTQSLTLNSLSTGQVLIEGDLMIVQASTASSFIELDRTLHSHSDFEGGLDGWTGKHTTDCLGTHAQGSCSKPSVMKQFSLPLHSQLVIEASYHMLGEWLNDSAFLKVDGLYVWMENGRTASVATCRDGFDTRIGIPVSVTIPHSARSASLEFGSTLESCSGSFSVDEIRVYVI